MGASNIGKKEWIAGFIKPDIKSHFLVSLSWVMINLLEDLYDLKGPENKGWRIRETINRKRENAMSLGNKILNSVL